MLTTRKSNLEKALGRLAEFFLPLHNLFRFLKGIRIGNHSVMDEIITRADTAKALDALDALEEWDESTR